MTGRPLALTIRQAEIIREAANTLPLGLRKRFRDRTDNVLARMPMQTMTVSDATGERHSFGYLGDGAVQAAVNQALRDVVDEGAAA